MYPLTPVAFSHPLASSVRAFLVGISVGIVSALRAFPPRTSLRLWCPCCAIDKIICVYIANSSLKCFTIASCSPYCLWMQRRRNSQFRTPLPLPRPFLYGHAYHTQNIQARRTHARIGAFTRFLPTRHTLLVFVLALTFEGTAHATFESNASTMTLFCMVHANSFYACRPFWATSASFSASCCSSLLRHLQRVHRPLLVEAGLLLPHRVQLRRLHQPRAGPRVVRRGGRGAPRAVAGVHERHVRHRVVRLCCFFPCCFFSVALRLLLTSSSPDSEYLLRLRTMSQAETNLFVCMYVYARV